MSIMTDELNNITILNAKVFVIVVFLGVLIDGAVNRLNNSVLEDKGVS